MTTPLVRYYLDEAASGQSPTTVEDSEASPVDLTLTLDGANPSFTSAATGRGLHWSTEGSAGAAVSVALGGTKLEGSGTNLTVEFVLDATGSTTGNIVWLIARNGVFQGPLGIYTNDATVSFLYFNSIVRTWPRQSGRRVYHLVFQSGEAVDADRCRLYEGGALVSPSSSSSITGGANWVIASDAIMLLGSNGSLATAAFKGKLYYLALYTAALGGAEITSQSAALATNDDSTPAPAELTIAETEPAQTESINAGVLSTGLEYVAEATSRVVALPSASSQVIASIVSVTASVYPNPSATSVVLGS